MHRKIYILFITTLLFFSSCKKYLDVNTNPNTATSSSPALVFPQATVNSASLVGGTTVVGGASYYDLGGFLIGYHANAGGYGGWGSTITYEYTSSENTGLWTYTYNNLVDYDYVVKQTQGSDAQSYLNATAKIMKVYMYQLLVDEYNDIPYTQSLQGSTNILPKYDKAEDIYKDLVAQLDTAIATINNAKLPAALTTGSDVLFGGSIVKWKQFANTLKLKLILRTSNTTLFTGTPSFSSEGFLTEDAIVNPGYKKESTRQNPLWNTYASTYTGSQSGSGRSRIPTYYIVDFYDGTKLTDKARGNVIYRGFRANTLPPRNQLGNTEQTIQSAPTGNTSWYIETVTYANAINTVGVLKGQSQGQPILLAAESYFLQAEANVRGLVTGDAKTNFNKGIQASFTYLYKNVNNTVEVGYDPAGDATKYIAANTTSRLVNYDLATTTAQKIEAIITQKYIANNMVNSIESWSEFRRTGYPAIDNSTQPYDKDKSFVSIVSAATTPDKLPGRLIYPSSEFSLNGANVPANVKVFGSYVFWDRRK